MSATIVKENKLRCSNCGHIIPLNAWGIPTKHQDDDYMNAIDRARDRLEKEIGFGIKEEHESNKKRSKEKSS